MSMEQPLVVLILCALNFYLGTRWAKGAKNQDQDTLIVRMPLDGKDAQHIVGIVESKIKKSVQVEVEK